MVPSPTQTPWLLMVVVLAAAAAPASAQETCLFSGKTDYRGQLGIVETSRMVGAETQIDVRLVLDARPLPLIHTHYVMQEISSWRRGAIQQVAVNDRYSFDGHIVRQQWDVYDRAADGLHAFRVQGKRLGEFQRQHPDFVQFWSPDMFGRPWLEKYPYSARARRPDLDLHSDLSLVRTPLALAFYWLRWLPPQGSVVPLFLPGFKEQKLVELAIGPLPDGGNGSRAGWKAPIQYPYLSPTRPSTALAWTTTNRHVAQLVFDLHGVEHSAQGVVHEDGCMSVPANDPAR